MIRPAPARLPRRRPLAFRAAVLACLALAAAGVLAPPPAARAQTPEEAGLAIAVAVRDRESGFEDLAARMDMTLRNRHGKESRRELRVQILETPGDGDKTLFVFDTPRDVKGTALLIHAHREGPDDQWLYLPALKRVKRIASSNRSGSFMGSEFAYEDMGSPEVEKFAYRHLRDEPCGGDGAACSVTERVPTDRKSGYSRQVVWRDRDELRVRKIEYYDRKDTLLKTLAAEDYELYLDRYWQARKLTMTNLQTGKSTVLAWSDIRFRTGLDPRAFGKTGLRRAR